MEHGEKTGLCTQVLWVGSDGAHCLTRRPEQNVIDMLLVLIGEGRDRPWYRKDQMKVRHREKLGLTILKPFGFSHRLAFWTMAIAATVIADALVVTPIALLDVTAECCRSTQLDRAHDAPLLGGQRGAMMLAIGFTVAAEHIRHFKPGAGHRVGA